MAYKKLNQQVSIKHALHGQNRQKIKEWTDYLSNNAKSLSCSYDLCLRFWPLSAFGGYFVLIAVLWG